MPRLCEVDEIDTLVTQLLNTRCCTTGSTSVVRSGEQTFQDANLNSAQLPRALTALEGQ